MRTFESLMDDMEAGEYVQDIGQIDKDTRKQLAKLVRKGDLKCFRMRWLGCFGPMKTTWRLNSIYDQI